MAHIHLLVGSTLGTAEYLAEHIEEKLVDQGHTVQWHLPAKLAALNAGGSDILLVVTSTHGAGDIPDNLQPFARELGEQQPDLSRCHYAVVGLGDSNYDIFCGAARQMEQLLQTCRANRIGQGVEIDVTRFDLPEDAADIWLKDWIPAIA